MRHARLARPVLALALLVCAPAVEAASPLANTFTYQGALRKSGVPVSATCDFQFGIWDQSAGGLQSGITQSTSAPVTAGLFTAVLNTGGEFGGNPFAGDARYLDIAVRCPPDLGFTSLSRVLLQSTPYALGLAPGAESKGGVNTAFTAVSTTLQGTGLLGQADSGANAWGTAGFSMEGIGVLAHGGDNTSAPNVALEVNGGALKVSGSVRPAFIFTTDVVYSGCSNILDPLLDGDPNAILIVTPRQAPTLPARDVWVLYSAGVWNLCSPSLATGMKYDILVIKQ
ncbi:MAG TPA: hypothetical protein VKF32_13255 [Thermoanaerobaculia bacterium]|nr:hypothetical protein [Thermoanaerobaculia bacterium]